VRWRDRRGNGVITAMAGARSRRIVVGRRVADGEVHDEQEEDECRTQDLVERARREAAT
jgi:hypothetical protein